MNATLATVTSPPAPATLPSVAPAKPETEWEPNFSPGQKPKVDPDPQN